MAAALVFLTLLCGIAASTWQMLRASQAEQQAVVERDAKEVLRSEAVANARQAKAVSDFLVEAFRSPSPKRDGRTVTIAEVLVRAAGEAEKRFADDELTLAALLHAIGESYRGLGLYQEAILMLDRARELRTRTVGRQHSDTIRCVSDLGWAYMVDERPKQALPLFEENYRVAREALGEKHSTTLQCKCDVAVCFLELGRGKESLDLIEETFAEQKATLGRRHEDTIESMFEMARNLEQAGRTDEAVRLYQEVIDLAADHSRPLAGLIEMEAMEKLAVTLGKSGRFDDAIAFADGAITRFETLIGPNHKGTRHAWESRASIYDTQIRTLANSVDVQQRNPHRALQLARTVLTLDPQPSRAYRNLGWAEYRNGHWQASIVALSKSCDLSADGQGNSFQWFFLAMSHERLGETERARGRYQQAVEWMDKYQPLNEELVRIRREASELLGVADSDPSSTTASGPARPD